MASGLKTIVIGGGTGFIGSALAKKLQADGYKVILISRKPSPWAVTWSELQDQGLPENTEAVVNLAGQNVLDPMRRWTPGFKQNVWASRVNTTKYLADAIRSASVKPDVFVTMSGVGYYPPDLTREYDENFSCEQFDFMSKLCTDWEASAQLLDELSVRTVTIRSGVVLGRKGGMIQNLYLPFFFGFGGPVGKGHQPMPWIHLHDIVGLFVHAIKNKELHGIMNGVAPQLITNKDFAKAFGKALVRPAIMPLPAPILNIVFGSERAKMMTEGQKVIPKKALETGYKFLYPDITSATKEFSKLVYRD